MSEHEAELWLSTFEVLIERGAHDVSTAADEADKAVDRFRKKAKAK